MHPSDVKLLERNAFRVAALLEPDAPAIYLFLVDRLAVSDPRTDHVFRLIFRSYYRLDNAGLTPAFKNEYFKLMEEAKRTGAADVGAIATKLYRVQNRKGQNTLQFSFATKLANLVVPNAPIYDSQIAALYSIRAPSPKLPLPSRVSIYLAFLEQVRRTYDDLISDIPQQAHLVRL